MKQIVFITLCAGLAASGTFYSLPSTPPTQVKPPPQTAPPTKPAVQPPRVVTSSSSKKRDSFVKLAHTTPDPALLNPAQQASVPGTQTPASKPVTLTAQTPDRGKLRALLEHKAQLVEQEANQELERLLPLLDLSPSEQDRIFAIFAVTSSNYDRAMKVGASRSTLSRIRDAIEAGATVEQTRLEEISEVVDEGNKIERVDSYLEKEEWWTNIVGDLESELDNTPLPVPPPNPPVILASPRVEQNPSDSEISVTKPTVFPSE